ncbi:MAG: amidase [Alphaproteobacteria bacterium]|nr:amidase [Alphaproteobacteria bacterium]
MPQLIADPLADGGIAGFAARLRRGETSSLAATEAYLQRIAALDGKLGAYVHVAGDVARRQARAIDDLLATGTDLGPLMGVPVGVKDIFAVEGMPTTAGSRVDVTDMIGPEGPFVKQLRQAGCVILGKLQTVEFALGANGTNYTTGTPRNPWDASAHRVAAGSSSGAGVAVAAGLCGFAIGSDTGGSVRGPASFCGTVGVKTTFGLWPLEGVFPLSKTFDSIGPLTRTARDAALVVATLTGRPVPVQAPISRLRFGRPAVLFEGTDAAVTKCLDAALGALRAAGAEIVEVELPATDELSETSTLFSTIARPELLARLGRDRFEATRSQMNPDVAARAAIGLTIPADAYVKALARHRDLSAAAQRAFEGFDAWLAPGKLNLPPVFPGAWNAEADKQLDALCAGPTRVVNLLGLCATSQPIHQYGATLPVGLQVICPGGADMRLLALALAVEAVVGPPPVPDLSGFLT